ncbi:hypothetical protein [Haloferula rosea]|uniref:Uncharacterized protein n=1 Tax=Haloferula rosea TaxID=490093 RepID=A0A934VDV8_9BACT|nr:hypothetical protein [Haloferula rosea]MBK1825421.1 hypothetical protein [Haloferula rosea]
MKPLYLLAAGAFFAAVSCERHSFEDTKVLHEQHSDHGDGHKKEADSGAEDSEPGH